LGLYLVWSSFGTVLCAVLATDNDAEATRPQGGLRLLTLAEEHDAMRRHARRLWNKTGILVQEQSDI
jgi:hypothetical protein